MDGEQGKEPLTHGATKPFPKHWGEPPMIQTMDYRPYPEGYGNGAQSTEMQVCAQPDCLHGVQDRERLHGGFKRTLTRIRPPTLQNEDVPSVRENSEK